ncbi:PREDICTED: uncharacterized protein LOC106330591 [Brassica oleracea var. oleracea]|uniref:uncharacterized protein LOC106330591 n=1 Tax=Brassica oleracea var. oleracea TaxID=109376 RepID=UPI0006A6EE6F|nr:PREDICTED: uncharacterized protein LOC106330591 [Brassica oleracea var. oleracea]
MKNLPDLCAFLGSHLGGSSNSTPPTAPVVREESSTAVEPSIPAPESVNTVPSGGAVTKKPVGPLKKMGKGKKRPASDSSAEMGREGSSEAAAAGTQSDEPPKKKAKAKKKKKNLEENVTEDQTGPEEEPVDPIEGVRTREAVIPEDSSDGARTEEGQDGSPVTPLTRKKKEKRADNRAAPDAFVQSLSDGSMNYVIKKYDSALKETIIKLKKAEKLARVKDLALNRKIVEFKAIIDKTAKEHNRLLEERTAQKTKFAEKLEELKGKIHSSREKVEELEREKAALEEEKAALEEEKRNASLRHVREMKWLKDSRVFEVTQERVRVETSMIAKCNRRFNNIRDREARREEFDNARLLHSQAFGTRKCLESLMANGRDIC